MTINQKFISKAFENIIKNNFFSHSYIFYNEQNIDLQNLVFSIIDSFSSNHNYSYGESENEKLNHTDIVVLDYEKTIKIDAIKELQERITYSPHTAPLTFVLIPLCEHFTSSAANAFLKTLEEPNENIIFFMSSLHINHVISTIKSRSQLIYVPGKQCDDSPISLTFSEFNSLPLYKKLSKCQDIFTDKNIAKNITYSWLESLISNEPSSISVQSLLLDFIYNLENNISLRLQLDSLCIKLDSVNKS